MNLSRRTLLGAGAAFLTLPATLRAAETVDVVIAGGGLAGLYAARLLAGEGAKVVVLEGAADVGGRLKTLTHLPGSPEAGGQTIDAMYARVLRTISDVGLSTIPRVAAVPGDTVIAAGKAMSVAAWGTSDANRLTGAARGLPPGQLYSHYLDAANPVPELADWRAATFAALDREGVERLLARAGAEPEALRLMQHWFDGGPMPEMSALFACRKRLVEQFGAKAFYRVKGGSQGLPQAMAASLGDAVRTGSRVVSIAQDRAGVEMRTAEGGRFRGRFGLVALPFPALRKVELGQGVPPGLGRAIRELPYSRIVLVTLALKRRFWEDDGLPPAMFVDGWVQRVTATPGQDGELHSLSVWLRGEVPDLSDAALGQAVIDELARLRPATRDALALADVTRWDASAESGGAYHYFGPGQIAALFDGMRQPWGRVRFAGEHLADMQQGMEGACEAAEREALALLADL
ncbi:MAG: FAD-dependent oxidoreductase [Novosphingobium sp.]